MADEERRDFEVGYGKPPKATQFKKGQSGNPKGRPKGSLNLRTILEKVASEKVQISVNGVKVRLPKLEVVITQMANQAAGGNLRASKEFLALYRLEQDAAGGHDDLKNVDDPKQDKDVLRQLVARLRRQSGEGEGGSGMGDTA